MAVSVPTGICLAQNPGAPPPPPQEFHFPQATLNSRGNNKGGPVIVDLPQPGFAAEITVANHGTTDWMQGVQVRNRSTQTIVSLRMGWAYGLPGGLEFHQGEVVTVQGGGGTAGDFPVPPQGVPVRPEVKYFLSFVEQVTLKDGTVANADHDQIQAMYKDLSEGKSIAVAKAKKDPDPNSTAAQVAGEDLAEWKQMTLTDKRAMVATLLADVLKLKVHQDMEPHPVYDLVVAKDGPKLTEYQPGDTVTAPGGRVLTGKVLSWFDPFTLVCQDTTMAELVNSLSGPNRAGRVVIDKTGLNGAYNFTVPIPYAPLPPQIQEMSDAPSTYAGLKKLGLEMVKSMGVTDIIVVDHVERPAVN